MANVRFTVVQPKSSKQSNVRFTVVQPKPSTQTQPTPNQLAQQPSDTKQEYLNSLTNNIQQVGSTIKNLQQKAQPFLQQDLEEGKKLTTLKLPSEQIKPTTTNVLKEKVISDLQKTYDYKQNLEQKQRNIIEGKTGQENLLSTVGAFGKDLVKGIFGVGESIADLGTYGAATLMGLTGRDDLKEALIKNAKADSTGQLFKNADEYYNYTAEKGFKEGEAGSAIAQGIGYVGGVVGLGGLLPPQISQIKLNKIPLVNKIPLLKGLQLPTTSVLSGTGSGMSEALNEGATFEQAGVYGVGKGLLTGVSEAIFGSVISGKTGEALKKAYGSNQLDDVFLNYLTKNMGKGGTFATKLAYSGIGEGLEENIEGLLTPYLKRMTYDEKAELYTSQKAFTDFMMGAVVALMIQSPSLTRQVNQQAQKTGQTEQQIIREAVKDIQPPAIADKNIETALNDEIDKAILQKSTRPTIEPTQQPTQEIPKTVKVFVKSKFSDKSAYTDVPVIRKEDNITLYQGTNEGENRQFWTPNKEYASRFGNVREKTGSFYKIDNGNRVTDVYVEAPSTKPLTPTQQLPTKSEVDTTDTTTQNINNLTEKQRGVYASLLNNQGIPETIKNDIKSQDNQNYMVVTDEEALNTASLNIAKRGSQAIYEDFKSRVNNNEQLSKHDIVQATLIANDLFSKGDTQKYMDIISDLAVYGTSQGQSTQALSILKRATPDGRLLALQKQINKINEENKNKKKWQPIKLSQENANNIKNAKNQKDLDNAVNKAIENISSQMPKTLGNRLNEWRYLSMLGNPKTHIRNIIANVAMKGTANIKTKIAASIEDVVKPSERTKTLQKPSQKTIDFVQNDVQDQKERIQGNDKYDINKQKLQPKQSKLAAFNSKMLELEDWWSSSSVYKNAMADYLTANKIDTDTINAIDLEKARTYAIAQAQEQTFRTASKLANTLSKLEKDSTLGKLLVGGIIPFKTTPINIAKTSIEYSPVGLIKAVTKDISDLKSGKITATKYIDNLSKGLTGTGIAMIGYFLSSLGMLRASGSDEDRKKWYEQSLGMQPYSLQIGDMSFTIDWLSPTAVPLFVGAELKEMQESGMNEGKITAAFDALSTVIDPLTEMSLLQGVSKTIKSFESNAITGVGINTALNYAGQFIPTIFGQISRTVDDTRRSTTGEGKGIEKQLKTFANKQIAKIPVLSRTLEPMLDEFGREVKTGDLPTRALQNFVSPSYIKEMKATKVDKKLLDLYEKTGETSVLPTTPSRYITVDKEKIYFTPAEYTLFAKTDGKTVLNQLKDFMNSGRYKYLSDEQKIKKISEIYRLGQQTAKEEFLKRRNK